MYLKKRMRLFLAIAAMCLVIGCCGKKDGANDKVDGVLQKALDDVCSVDSNTQKEGVDTLLALADDGNANAMFWMSFLYTNDHCLAKDDSKALLWLERSAEAGDSIAMYVLACAYLHGDIGLEENQEKGILWAKESARMGHADAEGLLGSAYLMGIYGVEKSFDRALYWLEKAARHGDAPSCFMLSSLYRGVWFEDCNVDLIKACVWAKIACLKAATKELDENFQEIYARLDEAEKKKARCAWESIWQELSRHVAHEGKVVWRGAP